MALIVLWGILGLLFAHTATGPIDSEIGLLGKGSIVFGVKKRYPVLGHAHIGNQLSANSAQIRVGV